jgi:hypothetical protein
MIVSIIIFFLTFGSIGIEYKGIATNITIIPTEDNRYKLYSALFSDGTICTYSHRTKKYTFSTYQEAMNKWNSYNPPYEASYYKERWQITTDSCQINESREDIPVLFGLLGGIPGLAIDISCIYTYVIWYIRKYKRERERRILPELERGVLAEQNGDNNNITPLLVPKQEKKGLDPYVAQLIAEASIARGDVCPVTLEPLSDVRLLVPECGHIISEAGTSTKIPDICYLCKKVVTYVVVKGKMSFEKKSEDVKQDVVKSDV